MRLHDGDVPRMRGAGVGSFFTNVFTELLPLGQKAAAATKKALQSDLGKAVVDAAKRKAVETGINVAEEALRGQNVKAAAASQIKRAGKELVEETVDMAKKRKHRGGGKGGKGGKKGKHGGGGSKARKGGSYSKSTRGKGRGGGGRKGGKKKPRAASNLLKQWL